MQRKEHKVQKNETRTNFSHDKPKPVQPKSGLETRLQINKTPVQTPCHSQETFASRARRMTSRILSENNTEKTGPIVDGKQQKAPYGASPAAKASADSQVVHVKYISLANAAALNPTSKGNHHLFRNHHGRSYLDKLTSGPVRQNGVRPREINFPEFIEEREILPLFKDSRGNSLPDVLNKGSADRKYGNDKTGSDHFGFSGLTVSTLKARKVPGVLRSDRNGLLNCRKGETTQNNLPRQVRIVRRTVSLRELGIRHKNVMDVSQRLVQNRAKSAVSRIDQTNRTWKSFGLTFFAVGYITIEHVFLSSWEEPAENCSFSPKCTCMENLCRFFMNHAEAFPCNQYALSELSLSDVLAKRESTSRKRLFILSQFTSGFTSELWTTYHRSGSPAFSQQRLTWNL